MDLLKENQKEVIEEALSRNMKGGGLSLPLGFGKTRVSVCLGLKHNKGPILVVLSLTLLASWLDEIPKAFGEDFPFEVMHKKQLKQKYGTWVIDSKTRLVLTTPDVLGDTYKEYNIETMFLNYIPPKNFGPTILEYVNPTAPILPHHVGPGHLFSTEWGCLIIDEIQNSNNILTDKCRAISCIFAHHRWGLSGTMFDEPKMERFLGYYTMLNLAGPRTLPTMKEYMYKVFRGFKQHLVHRETNVEFKNRPKYIEKIITHDLDDTELALFTCSKEVLKSLNTIIKEKKEDKDTEGVRTFNAYKLAMITYVRQFLICPIIPISSIYCDVADFSERSELSNILTDKFRSLKLDSWLDNEENMLSSRFKSILAKIEDHKNDHILIFSCFRTTITLFQHILDKKGYTTFTIGSSMSSQERKNVIHKFQTSEKGILLLPYSIGAEGLNLQKASVVMLMDLWWNSSKIQQAIGRAFRPGQMAAEINVYIFIGNTGMEKTLIEKNDFKKRILDELQTGRTKLKLPKLTMSQIMSIVLSESNGKYLKTIRSEYN